MKEEKGMPELTEMRTSTETAATGDPQSAENRRGPTWRGWVLSILVAIILSVTATLLLGGSSAFRSDRVAGGAGGCGTGTGSGCCPPGVAGR